MSKADCVKEIDVSGTCWTGKNKKYVKNRHIYQFFMFVRAGSQKNFFLN
jgi:hypothetical protein